MKEFVYLKDIERIVYLLYQTTKQNETDSINIP